MAAQEKPEVLEIPVTKHEIEVLIRHHREFADEYSQWASDPNIVELGLDAVREFEGFARKRYTRAHQLRQIAQQMSRAREVIQDD